MCWAVVLGSKVWVLGFRALVLRFWFLFFFWGVLGFRFGFGVFIGFRVEGVCFLVLALGFGIGFRFWVLGSGFGFKV